MAAVARLSPYYFVRQFKGPGSRRTSTSSRAASSGRSSSPVVKVGRFHHVQSVDLQEAHRAVPESAHACGFGLILRRHKIVLHSLLWFRRLSRLVSELKFLVDR